MQKIVIIGAGPAGLTAAYELLKDNKSYEVTIIEEEKQVGGISKTINHKGNRMDLGGHRFFSKDKRVLDFWQNFLPLKDIKVQEEKIMLKRRRVSRIYYLRKFFDYPITLNFNTIKNLGIIKMFSSGLSYIKSCIFKKKEDNLENFYINRFGKKLYSMFFENYTFKLWGRHPKEIDASWGAQRVKGLSIIAVLKDYFKKIFHIKNKHKETSLIEEFLYPKYGPGQLWETVASSVEKLNGKILKNTKVIKINKDNNKIKSIVVKHNNKEETILCDILISSMPIKDLINDMNDIDNKIRNLANNLPYRDFITVGLLVKELNVKTKENTLIPDCWIYVQEDNVKLGRIQVFNNWSPYMVKNNNTIWLGLEYFCNECDSFWNLKNKEIKDYAIKELIKMDFISKENIIDYHVEKVKKAYPAYFDSYKYFDEIKEYINTIDNLYCIGRNGQHRYNNMDHSMITAMVTVNNIKNNIKDKSNIWNVNTEKVYHEEKI